MTKRNDDENSVADATERSETVLSRPGFPAQPDPQPATSGSNYVDSLRRSRLVADEHLDRLLTVYQSRDDLDLSVASFLANSGSITPWQHARLREGQSQFEVGGCTLLDSLGSGAMSDVYLAVDPRSGARVAIKILKSRHRQNDALVDRFRLEGSTMQQLMHRNLLRCLRMGQSEGDWFLVVEYVAGSDLSAMVAQRGPCDFVLAADIIRQAAEGLHYLHERGIVHRDIKPSNLFLTGDGLVKILDLGLARVPVEGGESLTGLHRETFLGTPDFIAPEQVLECHEVDGRADLYALGGTFYYLLTGHAPFAEGSVANRLLKHQREAPESICFWRANTPAPLVEVCRRLLAKHPQDRFHSAEELSSTLRCWLNDAGAPSDSEAQRPPRRADARDDFDALAKWSGVHE